MILARMIDTSISIPDQVEQHLDAAAITLSALRSPGLRPAGCRIMWPDIVRDLEDIWWTEVDDIRPPAPSSDEVSRMDEALSWVQFLDGPHRRLRQVVNMRLIVHPISLSYRWSWRKIGERLGVSYHTAQAWHQQAVGVIAKKIAQPEFFASQTSHVSVFKSS